MKLIGSWRQSLDSRSYSGAVLMDLSKAFDTINHEILVAKLRAYGFNKESLEIILNHFSNRWQRTKICDDFSSCAELLQGVPRGSVLGPLDSDLKHLIERLEHNTKLAIVWFENNYMKLTGLRYETLWAIIGETRIWDSKNKNLLGLTIDRNLNFDDHVFTLCKKAGRKLSTLSRTSNYMSFEKKRILFKASVESQFVYCPLFWIFHSRRVNSKINHIHERVLRIVYKYNISSFEELLKKDKSFCIHDRNIQSLAIELFKVKTTSLIE